MAINLGEKPAGYEKESENILKFLMKALNFPQYMCAQNVGENIKNKPHLQISFIKHISYLFL